jgi:hypothetical protein
VAAFARALLRRIVHRDGFDAREIIERLTFVATKMPRGTSEGEGEAIALLDQARPEGMMES